jgi:hypothetical protein
MKVEEMDELQKLSVYMHYYINSVCLKHATDTVVYQTGKCQRNGNWEKKIINPHNSSLGFKEEFVVYEVIEVLPRIAKQVKLHKDMEICSFDEFKRKPESKYMGKDWKEKGWASEWWNRGSALEDWYSKFKNEIKLA